MVVSEIIMHFLPNPCVWNTGWGLMLVSPLVSCCCCCCFVAQSRSRVWLSCDPKDCSPPGSSVHGFSQARILEWVAISFSRGYSPPRDWTWISCISRQILYHWATREAGQYCFLIPVDWDGSCALRIIGQDFWITVQKQCKTLHATIWMQSSKEEQGEMKKPSSVINAKK